jgi:lysophospholipase L1-like esterase
MVCDELRRRFPGVEFDFINAGISSLGSTPGAFRFERDVLGRGQVDLLFAEAAVNDQTNHQTPQEALRGMEGIVRHARLANPAIDVVMLHFVDPEKMAMIRQGKRPPVIQSHEKVAVCYNVPSIDLAQEVTERIHKGEFTWEKDFLNLHPSPFGHGIYFRSIQRLLDAAWKAAPAKDAQVEPYPLPAPLDAKSYFSGRLVPPGRGVVEKGWTLVPRWRPNGKVGTREGFVDVPMLVAEEPGAVVRLRFEGTGAGVFVAAGPDAGVVRYEVDGKLRGTRDLFTEWSDRLHLPWAQVLAADLAPGEHEIVIRVAPTANPKSKGHAVRIVHFLVNGTVK